MPYNLTVFNFVSYMYGAEYKLRSSSLCKSLQPLPQVQIFWPVFNAIKIIIIIITIIITINISYHGQDIRAKLKEIFAKNNSKIMYAFDKTMVNFQVINLLYRHRVFCVVRKKSAWQLLFCCNVIFERMWSCIVVSVINPSFLSSRQVNCFFCS